MTLLLGAFVSLAFAGIYAMLFAMLGESAPALGTALAGRWRPTGTCAHHAGGSEFAASRRFNLA
jgi:hypothetical protein